MPNYDEFERLMRAGLVREREADDVAAEMSAIYRADRPTFARDKSQSELAGWLSRACMSLDGFFSGPETFTTSDDNSYGKDLYAVRSDRHIELKSPDGKTDANVGIKSVAWALADESQRLTTIMNEGMKERRAIWMSVADETARDSEIHDSKVQQMRKLMDYFGESLIVGEVVGPRLGHYARCVAVGLTKLREIQATFATSIRDLPLLLVADWELGLRQYEQSFLIDEAIRVASLEGNPESARVSLKLVGNDSGRSCLIYPNHKNSFHSNGVTIPASTWVKSACFHIWID